MNTDPGPPLHLATWEQLCEELSRRTTGFALIATHEMRADPTHNGSTLNYDGGWQHAWGLVEHARMRFRVQSHALAVQAMIEDGTEPGCAGDDDP